jgi:hypothetical protein
MAYLSADAVDLLRTLVLEVRALRQRLEAADAGIATGADAALIVAVYAVAGQRPFRAGELRDMAARPGTPEQALRGLLSGCRSNKAIGKALGAAAGKVCADSGLVLTAEPNSRGAIWRVSHAAKAAKR